MPPYPTSLGTPPGRRISREEDPTSPARRPGPAAGPVKTGLDPDDWFPGPGQARLYDQPRPRSRRDPARPVQMARPPRADQYRRRVPGVRAAGTGDPYRGRPGLRGAGEHAPDPAAPGIWPPAGPAGPGTDPGQAAGRLALADLLLALVTVGMLVSG